MPSVSQFLLCTFLLIGSCLSTVPSRVALRNITVEAQVLDNGDLLVEETLTYYFSVPMDEVIKRVYASGPAGHNDGIEDMMVRGPFLLSYDVKKVEESYMRHFLVLLCRAEPSSGEQVFVIRYTVKGALRVRANDNGDELVWMAMAHQTGEHNRIIEYAAVKLSLPDQATLATDDDGKYMAWYRTKSSGPESRVSSVDRGVSLKVELDRSSLDEKDSLLQISAVLKNWNENAPHDVPSWQLREEWEEWMGSMLLWLAALIPLMPVLLWLFLFREPKTSEVVPQLSQIPDNLSAAMVGTLVKGNPTVVEVVATLVELAHKGYMRIQEQQDDFIVLRTNKLFDASLAPHEEYLLASLFSKHPKRSLDSYRGELSQKLSKVYERIYQQLVSDSFFKVNPQTLHSWYARSALILLLVTMLLYRSLQDYPSTLNIHVLCASMVVTSALLYNLPKFASAKTNAGVNAEMNWKGFHQFLLSEVSKHESTVIQSNFEVYLPYTVIFGLEEEWISAWEQSQEKGQQAEGSYLPLNWFLLDETASGEKQETFKQKLTRFLRTASSVMQSHKL